MLILARHGQTAANAGGRMQGRADYPLDDVGQQQAVTLAKALPGVERVISSPLARAVETAEAFGPEVEIDERWLELDFGEHDDKPIGEIPAEVWQRWRTDPDWAPEGGESMARVRARVWEACAELLEDFARRDVVVVSHVSPIKQAVGWALELSPELIWRTHLDVASISRIAVRNGEPLLVSFNEVSHLGDGSGPQVYGVNWRR